MRAATQCEYDNSRVGFTDENGRLNSYARCDMCGKWHKGQYGFILRYTTRDMLSSTRKKLCSKCAANLAPELDRFCNAVREMCNPQEDTSELGMKIQEVSDLIEKEIEEKAMAADAELY